MERSTPGRSWPENRVNEFLDQISAGGEDYRRLVERLPAIVYASELGENGRWRYVSPQVEEILGYTPGGVAGRPGALGEAAAPRGPRAGARRRRRARRSAIATRRRSTTGCSPATAASSGSSTRPCSSPTKTGTPVWHGVLYDITERKIAEQEARRGGRPAGRGRAPRRPGAEGRRPGRADGRGGLADGRDRGSRRRLHLGDRPRRPPPRACARGSRIASSARLAPRPPAIRTPARRSTRACT